MPGEPLLTLTFGGGIADAEGTPLFTAAARLVELPERLALSAARHVCSSTNCHSHPSLTPVEVCSRTNCQYIPSLTRLALSAVVRV